MTDPQTNKLTNIQKKLKRTQKPKKKINEIRKTWPSLNEYIESTDGKWMEIFFVCLKEKKRQSRWIARKKKKKTTINKNNNTSSSSGLKKKEWYNSQWEQENIFGLKFVKKNILDNKRRSALVCFEHNISNGTFFFGLVCLVFLSDFSKFFFFGILMGNWNGARNDDDHDVDDDQDDDCLEWIF